MKTHLIYSQNNHINNNNLAYKRKKSTQQEFKEQTTREKNYENRPARAISFGGSAVSRTINSLIENKGKVSNFVNGTINFVNENEAAYNAIYSLLVAGIIKPIAVMHMPGSEEKDKQIVATKNFLQAFLGSFLGLTIGGGFVKKAMDKVKINLKLIDDVDDNGKIKALKADSSKVLELAKDALKKEHKGFGFKFSQAVENAKNAQGFSKINTFAKSFTGKTYYTPTIDEISEKAESLVKNFESGHLKIFQRNPKFVQQLKHQVKNAKSGTTYADAFETLWKNSTGALTSIGKAKISSILLPGVMAFLFAKKNLEKERAKEEEQRAARAKETTLTNSNSFKTQQAKFQQMMNKNSGKISFSGGLLSKSINGLAQGIEYMGMSKGGEKLTKALAHAKKPSARMSDIESFAITAYWLQNTARSKKIEPSQKLGLNIHSALVTIVSSTTAFIIDWALDGLIGKAKDAHSNKLNSIVDSVKNNKALSFSNPELDLGDLSAAARMAVKDSCLEILDCPNQEEAIRNALYELKQTKTIQNAIAAGEQIDENLLKRFISALKKTEPINQALKEQCGNMMDAKKISKTLSNIDLFDEKAVNSAVKKLTDGYGKKLSKFKSLTIFTLVVRFLVPVLMVPISGKLKRKVVELAERNDKNKTKA